MQTQTTLEKSTLNRISEYAEVTGTSIPEAINDAVNEWMDDWGDLIISDIREKERRKRLQSKSRQ